MKKHVLLFLLLLLLLPCNGFAETGDSTGFELDKLGEDTVFLVNADDPDHAVLGLAKNEDERRYPASTTKILTCIIALETADLDEPVKVSKRACNLSPKNSKMGLKPGESFPLIDLLYGLMLPSGNDAAIAIAEHLGGSVSGFAELMNKKAAELNMHDSHFTNPSGLHNSDHYTTAHDLAVLTAYALQNERFAQIVSTVVYDAQSTAGRKIELRNVNRLLRDATASDYKPYSCLYEYAIGVKTGDTHLAGRCLVAAARRGNTTYICVLLRGEAAPDGAKRLEKDRYLAQRFYDAIDLFEYAFLNDTVELSISDLKERCLPDTYAIPLDPLKYGATEALYSIDWHEGESLSLPRWQADLFAKDPFPEENLRYAIHSYTAPVGSKAGTVTIESDGTPVFTGDLIVEEYNVPPTPEPSPTPYFPVTELSPTATAQPGTAPSDTPGVFEWFFRLFRCNPTTP